MQGVLQPAWPAECLAAARGPLYAHPKCQVARKTEWWVWCSPEVAPGLHTRPESSVLSSKNSAATPLVPAIRAGADRLLVVSLNRSPESRLSTARSSCRRNPFPGATFLLGRLLGSMMDRQLDYELRRLEMFNQLIGAGRRLHGSRFLRELDRAAMEFRNAPYRRIEVVHIRPSRDLNELALEALRESPGDLKLPGTTGKVLRRILLSQPLLESELTSLLLFSPAHARKLVDLGYRDAEERQEDLTALFGSSDTLDSQHRAR